MTNLLILKQNQFMRIDIFPDVSNKENSTNYRQI